MFAPNYIENKLKFFPHIKEAVCFGDKRDQVCAFINIDFEAVGNWAERRNLPYAGYTDLAGKPEVLRADRDCVEKVNADLAADPAWPARSQPLPGAAQGTGRRRRRADPHPQGARGFIAEKYGVLVDALYGGAPSSSSRRRSSSRTAAPAACRPR
jgi:long-chain acyl-CoA synthetase